MHGLGTIADSGCAQTQVLDEMDFAPIVDRDADGNVKLMDARIFKDEVMGMTIE